MPAMTTVYSAASRPLLLISHSRPALSTNAVSRVPHP